MDKMLETFDEGLYQQYVGKKNTAFTGRTGQLSTDSTSGSHVRSATHSPTDTLGVPFDDAKVRRFSQSARNNVKKFKNGDAYVNNESLSKAYSDLRKLFAMSYSGRSNYVVYDTPKGRMAFRLTDHNAFGKNFERDKAKQNISVFVGRNEYGVPESELPYKEYKISIMEREWLIG